MTLDSHNINHVSSKTKNEPNSLDLGIETRYNNKILQQEMAFNFARLYNQYLFKNRTANFSAKSDKQDEDSQVLHESGFFIKLKSNQNLTESDTGKIDINSPLENQIQNNKQKTHVGGSLK